MKLNEIIHRLIEVFFVIYTFSMLATIIWCTVQHGFEFQLDISYLLEILLFTLAADLPLLVFYSKKPLTKKQTIIRVVIHTVLLEALLLPIGYAIGMWGGIGGFIFFFLTVIAVDVCVYLVSYISDRFYVASLNEELKERNKERNK